MPKIGSLACKFSPTVELPWEKSYYISRDAMDNFLLQPTTLSIQKSVFSTAFLRAVKSKIVTSNVRVANLIGECKEGINQSEWCIALPNLVELHLLNVILSNNWITGNTECPKNSSLKLLTVEGCVQPVEQWNIDEFVAFFKKQHPLIKVEFGFRRSDLPHLQAMMNFFAKRFSVSELSTPLRRDGRYVFLIHDQATYKCVLPEDAHDQ
uniref:F-box/FBD/LRR-repeat protein n=1 Tax=Panagrellus redivivus TaxID=6233 RepID=A0A7E4VS31_PANRE